MRSPFGFSSIAASVCRICALRSPVFAIVPSPVRPRPRSRGVFRSGDGREANVTITHYRSPGPAFEQEIIMAGHSKWANIQHRKGKQDAKRGKLFTKLIREITVAAQQGGGDSSCNPRLRAAIIAARGANMTADTIDRAVKRGAGGLEGSNLEEIRYEGYGL